MFLFNYLESCLFSPGCRKTGTTALGTEATGFMGLEVLEEEGLEKKSSDATKLRRKGPKVSKKADGGPSCI